MPEERVTLRGYSSEAEAQLAASHLQHAGIKATVARLSRYRAMGGGGYNLRVLPADSAKAQGILKALDREVDMDEYVDPGDKSYRRCPACNSVNIHTAPLSPTQRAKTITTAGIALLFLKRPRTCKKCGNTWQA
jgi:predicted Zn-ribbon and HTH transcriptional regulator